MKTEIYLPFPPSVNGLFNGGRKSPRRFKSARYVSWIADARSEFYRQYPLPFQEPRHAGRVNVVYVFKRPDKRRRDISNNLKAVDDLIDAVNVLRDDSLIHGVTAFWDDNESFSHFQCKRPQTPGVMLTITDVGVL